MKKRSEVKKFDSNPLPVKVITTCSLYARLVRQLLQAYYTVFTPPMPHCVGTFMEFGKFVWIHDPASITELYHSGSFGKGNLSRSDPTWFTRTVEENKESLEEITIERRRKRRQKKLATSSIDIENNLTSAELLDLTNHEDLEHFQLDLYEAFFLVYAVNALSIKDQKQVWTD
jgi:tRNA-splicing endonuclease subunit Sen2